MVSKIEQLKTKIKSINDILAINLEDIKYIQTKSGWEAKKRQGKEELPVLKIQLMNAILENSITIYGLDDLVESDSFGQYMTENDPTSIVLDYYSIENRIIGRLTNLIRKSYSFNSETVTLINNELYAVSNEIKAIKMPIVQVNVRDMKTVSTLKEFRQLITATLDATFGDELRSIYLRFELGNLGVNKLDTDKYVVFLKNIPANKLGSVKMPTNKAVVVSSGKVPGTINRDQGMSNEELVSEIVKSFKKKKVKTETDNNNSGQ